MANDKIKGSVYEHMSNGNLYEYVRHNETMINQFFILKTLKRIIKAIEYIHSMQLIYRDLKPSNILLDHDQNPFITDFEIIRKEQLNDGEEMTQNLGSAIYASPEQIKGKGKIEDDEKTVSYPTDILFVWPNYFLSLYEKEYV